MKKVALVLALMMMVSSLGVLPVSATTAGEQGTFTWSDLTWNTTCGDSNSCTHDFIYIDDPYLHYELDCAKEPGVAKGVAHILTSESVSLPDDVDLEIRCRIDEFSEGWGYYIYYSGLRTILSFKDGRLIYEDASNNQLSVKVDIGNEFHCWRLEKRGSQMTVFMDSEKIVTYELRSLNSSLTNCIQIVGNTMGVTAPKVTLGYIRYYTHYDRTTLNFNKAEYYEGDNVTITAPSAVDFYLNNVKVGSGTSSTISGLKAGTYKVTAKASGSSDALPVDLIIKEKRTATLSATETISYGGSANLSVALSDNNIAGIDYYINGSLAETTTSTSYSASLPIGTATAYAEVFYADGTVLRTNMSYINVTATGLTSGSINVGQEYELSYSITGNSRVNLYDGVFGLSLTYAASTSKLTYLTSANKEESVSAGTGKFKVVVSSGIAEVYWNGQFLVSFSMPLDSTADSIAIQNATDVSLTGNGTKATVYSRKIGSETTVFDENINMGLYYSLEFDKKTTSAETIHLFDGEFEISMELNNGITALTQKDPDSARKNVKIADSVKSGYYRITVYRGLAQIFVNNEYVASFIAPRNSHKTEITRTMSSGTSTMMAIKNTDDIYYFEDDFAGGKVLDWSEYWYCPTYIPDSTNNKLVTASLNGETLRLSSAGTYVLDAIADNFTFKASVSSAPSSLSVALKYRDEYNTIKLTYGTSGLTSYWNLYEVKKGTSTRITRTKSSTKTGDYEIIVKDDKLTFKIGTTTIFDNVALSYGGNGKIGFMLPSSSWSTPSMTIDSVSYVGNGKVNSGVNYGLWEGFQTIEAWPDSDGNAVIKGGKTLYTTADLGQTWNSSKENVNTYLGSAAIKLNSGEFLTITFGTTHHNAKLYPTPEDAVNDTNSTFEQQIQPDDVLIKNSDVLHGRLMQAKEGRIYYVMSTGSEIYGTIHVYYSDNKGKTWTSCETPMNSSLSDGLMLHEPDIVELPDGTIRLYARTDSGFICYTDSSDEGKTFDTEFKMSQLISPTTCFAVDRDGYTDTYYAIFEYDVSTADMGTHQGPRNRFGLAVSYDGCKTWKYIMEMDDRGDESALWHNNPNIRVVNGIVYASLGYYGDTVDDFTATRCMTFVVDPSKIKTRDRFANAHYVIPDYPTVHDTYKNHVVLPKTTGTALIAGQSVPALVNEDGFVYADVVAEAFGATKVQTNTGVSLNIGDGTVTFAADGTNASSDGKFINVKKAAEQFGKTWDETENAYVITNTPINSIYVSELDNLRLDTPRLVKEAISDFKKITSATALKTFITGYESILGVDEDFSDDTYEKMYTTYQTVNLANVNDYATLVSEVDSIANPQKAQIKLFLAELNAESAKGDAEAIKTLLEENAELLPFEINTSGIKNPLAIYKKMTGITYYSLAEIENVFYAAFEAQKYVEEGKTNAVVLSSVSKYFDGWSAISSNNCGGVSLSLGDEENVATLSAYDGLKSAGKESVETGIDGYVYQAPGSFGENIEKEAGTVDSEKGTVSFNSEDANFTIKDASGKRAKSNTIITVFDITKPVGRVTGTFSDGYNDINIDFTADGTNVGKLPGNLRREDKLTYRIEKSFTTATVMAKASTAADTEYVVLGTQTAVSATQPYWFVNFEGAAATAEISKIGIYAATPNVKYDTSDYTLLDNYNYSANGESGHTMQDLISLGTANVKGTGISVDDSGNLKIAPTAVGGDGIVNFGGPSNSSMAGPLQWFDRAEIDMTVSLTTGAHLHIYYADNSGNRYEDYFWGLEELNNLSTKYEKKWTTGKFYTLKFVTQVAEYDETGRPRTNASLYVKDETGKWVCLARNQILNWKQAVSNPQIAFTMISRAEGEEMIISDLSVKTYAMTAGEYSYINSAVEMPKVDYNFTFDLMRINGNIPTEFVIGGTDYHQTFSLETDNEDTWYRFYGTVKMVPESKANGTKNAITLYMADKSTGNITTLAENLPMSNSSGNGIKFRIADTATAGVKLKNIRVYNGKALDVISGKLNNGSATVIADFLNDGVAMSDDAVILTGVYDNAVLSGAGKDDLTDDLDAYDTKRVTIRGVGYNTQAVEPQIKIFTWKDLISLVPLTAPVTVE